MKIYLCRRYEWGKSWYGNLTHHWHNDALSRDPCSYARRNSPESYSCCSQSRISHRDTSRCEHGHGITLFSHSSYIFPIFGHRCVPLHDLAWTVYVWSTGNRFWCLSRHARHESPLFSDHIHLSILHRRSREAQTAEEFLSLYRSRRRPEDRGYGRQYQTLMRRERNERPFLWYSRIYDALREARSDTPLFDDDRLSLSNDGYPHGTMRNTR